MNRGVFITGTDTGVGKTVVTAGIVRWLRGHGLDVLPMKPVQTGAERRGGKLIAPDLDFCLSAAGVQPGPEEISLMSPYLYEPACSPHLAGRISGRYPDIATLQYCLHTLLARRQAIVVEGAGGIMVPLNEQDTMLDLMKSLALPVVLVSRVGLGAINHALLSLHALRAAGLEPLGVIFNQAAPPAPEDRFIAEDNPGTVARFGGVDVLGNVGYFDPRHPPEERWQDFERSVPGLQRIREALESGR
jgi:dethiobiotin synthetase